MAAAARDTLRVNGQSVATNFIVQGGVTYVPVSAVAKVLGGNVQKMADGFEIVSGGGAMVRGAQGKLGQTLVGKGLQFTAVKLFTGDSYKKQFSDGTVDASGPDSTIVATTCRIRNTTNKQVFINPTGGDLTALADTDEHTYQFDSGMAKDIPPGLPSVLPGATYTFALTASVPKSAKLKALVYQTDGFPAKTVFRVDLTEPRS